MREGEVEDRPARVSIGAPGGSPVLVQIRKTVIIRNSTGLPSGAPYCFLAHAHQQFHGELVEAFVGEAFGADSLAVEFLFFQGGAVFGGEGGGEGLEGAVGYRDLGTELLDFLVGVPAGGFVFEDHVGADAAFGKFADAVVVFGAVGVGVEMERAVVRVVGEELDEEEGLLDVGGAEAEVLVVAAGDLVVKVDVEKFAGVDGLGDVVAEVEAGDGFVGDFGVDADHVGMLERLDESEAVAGGGEVDVSAGFVGFGFEGEAVVVALLHGVFAEEVEGLAEAIEAIDGIFAGIGFGTFASAPEDVDFRAELGAEVHGGHGFLDSVRADFCVAGGEGAVFEDGVAEEVGGGHGDFEVVVVEGFFEVGDDTGFFGGGGVDGDKVVVVEVDAVDAADGAEEFDDLGRGELRADGTAEGVAAGVADGPETEGEFFGGGCEGAGLRHVVNPL